MYVVRTYLGFNDSDLLELAKLSKNLSDFKTFFAEEFFSAIFWCKHNVILTVPTSVC